MKHLVTITIPVYKDRPNASEIASYNQCLKVLGKYPITLFVPSGMSTANYDTSSPNVNVLEVPHRYLNTREAYSAFMLDQNFYKQFIDSEYILIYQLDAWVFRDELEYWCSQGYHYIGAPWSFKGTNNAVNIGGVGNGGFSLRHVSKSIEVLDEAKKCRESGDYRSKILNPISPSHNKTMTISLINNDPTKISSQGLFTEAMRTGKVLHAEDGYWAGAASVLVKDFRIPSGEIALKFAMEGEAPTLYALNNNTLPFGCHAWGARTPDFWNKHIKYDKSVTSIPISGDNGAAKKIVTIFYKNGDSTAESKAKSVQLRHPHVKIRAIDMGDKIQIVDINNTVIQGQEAINVVNTLLSPNLIPSSQRCDRIQFKSDCNKSDCINILIRTSNRPRGFKRMIESIRTQTYKNYRIIASVDNDDTESYVKEYSDVEYIRVPSVVRLDSSHCPYNTYFNYLINEVSEGWIFFVDDDDTLNGENTLETISKKISNPDNVYIFKMQFTNRIVPDRNFGSDIVAGDIATPNFIINKKHANRSIWPDRRMGDFTYISGLVKELGKDSIRWVDEIIYIVNTIGAGKQVDIKESK